MSFIKSNHTLGILLIIQSLLIFVPMYILGTSINWPESTHLPGNQVLPLIFNNSSSVTIGYFVYLLYSILFLFTGSMLVSELDQKNSKILKVASISAGLSSLARTIGILRWLIPFPILAVSYMNTNNPNIKLVQETVFDVMNNFGGAIGEMLGVSIFAAIWSGIISWQFICRKELPSWLGYFGIISTIAALGIILPIFGASSWISAEETLFHFWLLTVGIYFLRKKN
jgi:Domain of unknown function (DUF4386)